MLNEENRFVVSVNKFLDLCFHLPTLLTMAVISVIILWQITDAGLHIGGEYIRLNTNQGNMTLEWSDGCCDVDW
jgi:hypothetical protein